MTLLVITLFLALVMVTGELIALPAYLAVSLITLLAFGLDKRRALTQGWRLPERLLHILALMGGWPGALVGIRQFRHKTQKKAFLWVLFAIVAVHYLVWGTLAWQRISGA
ncbi:DUF1294 domain-containing protein [Ferrimonas balearica]|uniref:DUF1294 domain-containing protein n=1 Tax=Ferrimonas balearica TaxID=44012 RepID=UPI001C992914|nr:DUF1294 domain-containing protein [Ferrimonas balearica]MBY5991704.1 DUF1294 domain-containing protein [Ferrimonas balearica]